MNVTQAIEQASNDTVQVQANDQQRTWYSPMSMLMMLTQAGDVISPWWSKQRDMELRRLVHNSDHLSGAVYNMAAKLTSIPVKIEARDKSIKSHVDLARTYTDLLLGASQFGEGWSHFYGRFVEDLFTQDNGAFAEVIGPGDKEGPITGMAIAVANLDASRCTRTGNPQYPVIYEDIDGRLHKLHYTRVIYASQMPSPILDMFGVGFSAVSRAVNAAQNLMDIATYKMEKLGSRPPRQMFITGGGLDPEDLQLAMSVAERSMNNQGLKRYSKTVVAGNRNIPDPKLQIVNMSELPDGFDEKESTVLGMSVIAMAFGMDARELFPAMESGATKADSIVQHMKQRGKGPGQTLELTEKHFDTKFLPPFLMMTFDYQDDAQDRQQAEIEQIRSQTRVRNDQVGATTPRIERQKMVESGEISQEQYEELELYDGRLPDGLSVETLFYIPDSDYQSLLGGTSQSNYESKYQNIVILMSKSKDVEFIRKARRALAAIDFKFVQPAKKMEDMQNQITMNQQSKVNPQKPGGSNGNVTDSMPDNSYQNDKFGRTMGADETTIRGDMQADMSG